MSSSKINYNVYQVQYNIKNIKKASALQDKLTDLLPKCNLSDEDFKTLKDNIKSFKSISKSIIKGNIPTTECKLSINTLIALNSKSQSILYHKRYSHNIQVMTLKDCYNNIDEYLKSSQSAEKLFLKYFVIVLLATSKLAYDICNVASQNNFLLYRLIPLLVIGLAINLTFSKRISLKLKILYCKYTIHSNTYIGLSKLTTLKSLITFIISLEN